MADGVADINRCPPGGAEGIVRLAALTGRPVLPLDAAHGTEGPRALAVIDEAWCIGCTLCIKACPVDCIVGASKLMHTVIDAAVHRLRTLRAGLPGGLHRDGAGHGRTHRLGRLECCRRRRWRVRATASARSGVERDKRENDERLAAKAQAKLADLDSHTLHTDPEVIEKKRAVIEAALARARQRGG